MANIKWKTNKQTNKKYKNKHKKYGYQYYSTSVFANVTMPFSRPEAAKPLTLFIFKIYS